MPYADRRKDVAFVRRVQARVRVGPGTRDPATYSDDYLRRLARSLRKQQAAGATPSKQAARRGPVFTARVRQEQMAALARGKPMRTAGLEHPRGRWVGPTDDRGRPDEQGSIGFRARQYRRLDAARRFLDRLPTERVQVIGFGTLAEGYSGVTPFPQWRVLFTGDLAIARLRWSQIASGYHVDWTGFVDQLVFERVIMMEIRWGPGLGD